MNSRLTKRLVAALVLLLAAFGIVRLTVPGPGAAQSVVYNRARQRQTLCRKAEPLQAVARPRRTVKTEAVEMAPADLVVYRWRFQRPPPVAPSFA